ncbi:MAG: 30S ribosome-binding factor RbfA [Limisphaerales bacterium]
MPSHRQERVRELLKRELSRILVREFQTANAGLMSVNEVALTGDLKQATVYVGIVGSADQCRRGFGLLDQHRLRLQSMLGAAVILKHTPELRFVPDESIQRGNRVLRIIDEIETQKPGENS